MHEEACLTLSVVMPAYNEEGSIEKAIQEIQAKVLDPVGNSELICVNDGSRDRTGAILDKLARSDQRIRPIHQTNAGHGAALRNGLDRARGEYIFLIDSDRQIPIEAFDSLWSSAKERDGAFGVRSARHDPWIRLILTRIVRLSLKILFGVSLRDANAPFKIIRRSAWADTSVVIPPDTLAPSIFLAVSMSRRPYDFVEVDVPHRIRETGKGSLKIAKLVSFCTTAFGQLLRFRRQLIKP
jgi:dolichol-phosphate mannosyltransferase